MSEKIPYFRSYYEPPDPPVYPRCPKCGADDYSTVYIGEDGWCGCDVCISVKDANDYWDEQDDIAKEAQADAMYEEYKDRLRGL